MGDTLDIKLYSDKDCTIELPNEDGIYYIELGSISKEVERLKIIKLFAKNVGDESNLAIELGIKHNTIDNTHTLKRRTILPQEIVPFEIVLDLKKNLNVEILEFCIRKDYYFDVFGKLISELQGKKYSELKSRAFFSHLYILNTKRINNTKRYNMKLNKKDIYRLKLKDGQINKLEV